MRLPSLTSLMASIAVTLCSLNAFAATTVYEQAPVASPGGTYYFAGSSVRNDPTDPGFNWSLDTDVQSWDTFALHANVTINRIGWYGNNADGDFAVDLYAATCISCGATKVGGSGQFAHTVTPQNGTTLLSNTLFTQAQVHKTFVSGSGANSLYSYYIDLPTSLSLAANSFSGVNALNNYTISIVNNYSTSPFGWALSDQAAGHFVYGKTYSGSKYLGATGDLAFSLIDTSSTPSVSAVPEPESYALMLAGLGLMGAVARKRQVKQG